MNVNGKKCEHCGRFGFKVKQWRHKKGAARLAVTNRPDYFCCLQYAVTWVSAGQTYIRCFLLACGKNAAWQRSQIVNLSDAYKFYATIFEPCTPQEVARFLKDKGYPV